MLSQRSLEAHRHFSRGDLRRCGADGKKLYLTIEEAAAHFGVAKHTVLTWVRLGAVHEYTLGGRMYLDRVEVLAYWQMFRTAG